MSNDLPMSRSDHERASLADAKVLYARHEITARGDGWWHIRDPASSNLWCHILAIGASTLYVGGDGPTIGFEGGSADGPRRLVSWIGRQTDLQYCAAKAGRWFGDHKPFEARSVGVALYDIDEWLREMESEEDYDEGTRSDVVLAREEIDGGIDEYIDDVLRDLYAEVGSYVQSEFLFGIGEVVSQRVILGVAAVARLNELLSPGDV